MTTATHNEAQTIARILAGEKELFHDLIRPYERMVYLTVFAMLKNETEAEDAAQDAFVNAYRYLASFRAESKFSTWLTMIAINQARQKLRRDKKVGFESIEETIEDNDGEFTPAFLTDWREVPLEALERKELREALQKAVTELPDKYRQVFSLRDIQGLSIQETSEALNMNPGLVKIRLRRARIMLQKSLVPFLKNTPPAYRRFGRAQ
ncbi:MAG: sigma-70 family RNA polymerase sigma factor [Acidobacteria bacterium]|nr:sigma-70 family RNA polymerase sigma factor [Acidobacteriota bacterium]MBS1866225.1 sigma-70 family RNA polymerase sigma factor [Acidobacteriota bacterium]